MNDPLCQPLKRDLVLGTYKNLFCRRCYVYDCPIHPVVPPSGPQEPVVTSVNYEPCSEHCYLLQHNSLLPNRSETLVSTSDCSTMTSSCNTSTFNSPMKSVTSSLKSGAKLVVGNDERVNARLKEVKEKLSNLTNFNREAVELESVENLNHVVKKTVSSSSSNSNNSVQNKQKSPDEVCDKESAKVVDSKPERKVPVKTDSDSGCWLNSELTLLNLLQPHLSENICDLAGCLPFKTCIQVYNQLAQVKLIKDNSKEEVLLERENSTTFDDSDLMSGATDSASESRADHSGGSGDTHLGGRSHKTTINSRKPILKNTVSVQQSESFVR